MRRCAIYTRKSSDEGLDQQFNSLDAQRESCEAYVLSQAGEGWIALPKLYDDGGYSGGSMQRPGLQELLADIRRGRIDVVVVYKIDRLTRSLADFARIVEQFDKHEVSFVSVTQAFNTTSSMGRLTLNVLLSFAQFEREVTGERIRDKIAASKAKGMWMGGLPPLGYDPPSCSDRMLLVNEQEAVTVRSIFVRYLELGSVHTLVRDLAQQGVVSKVRTRADGSTSGGQPFSRGALFHLLNNRIYRGEIVHKGEVYPGLHEAIVRAEMFDKVQRRLDNNRVERTTTTSRTSPLAGKLFLANGERLTPTHTRGAGGQAYRYYVPFSKQRGQRDGAPAIRLPAERFEQLLRSILDRITETGRDPLEHLQRVDLHEDRLSLYLPSMLRMTVRKSLRAEDHLEVIDDHIIRLSVPWQLPSGEIEVAGIRPPVRRDPVLINALRAAHAMLTHDASGRPLLLKVPSPRYERRLARLAFLSPALQAAIIDGRQPVALTLAKIVRGKLPICWKEQEKWAARRA